MFLINKYNPKCLEEVIGHDNAIDEIKEWFKKWKKGRALLLYGPPGIGKTALAFAFAKEEKLEIFRLDTDDVNDPEKVRSLLTTVSKQRSLFFKGRLILIDSVDTISKEDKGLGAEIVDIIDSSGFPVIMTAIDAYNPKIKAIRSKCSIVKMKKINSFHIFKKLRYITQKEGLDVSPIILKNISDNSQGDLRSAIIDLETVTCGKKSIKNVEEVGFREREINIFEVLSMIFKTNDIQEAIRMISYCDKDIDDVFWWVEENVPVEYEKPEEIALALDFLSRADLFRGRVYKNQNYRLKMYMRNMIAGVALAKKMPYNKYSAYKYPSRIMAYGVEKEKRYDLDKTAEELGKKLHCSKKSVKGQMPFLEVIMKRTS